MTMAMSLYSIYDTSNFPRYGVWSGEIKSGKGQREEGSRMRIMRTEKSQKKEDTRAQTWGTVTAACLWRWHRLGRDWSGSKPKP